MIINTNSFDIYLVVIVNGIFTGFSVAIGSWIANAHIINNSKKFKKKIRKWLK
jgi:hypothetical protein